jgi:hypothetical protein
VNFLKIFGLQSLARSRDVPEIAQTDCCKLYNDEKAIGRLTNYPFGSPPSLICFTSRISDVEWLVII